MCVPECAIPRPVAHMRTQCRRESSTESTQEHLLPSAQMGFPVRRAAVAEVPPSSTGLAGTDATTAHKGASNLLGATGASTSVLGPGGGCEAVRLGATPVTPTVFCLHRLDNVHGSRVEPSETARMNSMDRHIQQTNDRLQCIKQVGVACAPPPPLPSVAQLARAGRARQTERRVGEGAACTMELGFLGAGRR